MENTTTKTWIRFKDLLPMLNETIDIYWSTGEVTENTIWKNDVVWTSNEIPVFWSRVINIDIVEEPIHTIKQPKDILLIIEKYIENKVDEGIAEQISELNKPDGALIWECIIRALEKAKVPHSKWDAIQKHVQKSMNEDGWEFHLS